jgi:hypothetical protein
VQGKCGPVVRNVDEVLRQVQQELQDQQKQWVAQGRMPNMRLSSCSARC